jgi:hypothetical protein
MTFRNRTSPVLFGAVAISLLCGASVARADYARPAEPSPYMPSDDPRPATPYYAVPPEDPSDSRDQPPRASDSTLVESAGSSARFQVGPALLLAPANPGFFTALDFGARAVGGRISAAWLRTESDQGLSAYDAELWIDFRHRYDLHPIVGAGASWLHGSALGEHQNVGAGVLRGALEYELPLSDAEARVGVSGTLLVPAIATERSQPWLTLALGVGIGL